MSIVSVDGQIQRRYTAKIRNGFEMGGKDTVRALGTAAIISDPQMIPMELSNGNVRWKNPIDHGQVQLDFRAWLAGFFVWLGWWIYEDLVDFSRI